ncbi:MAG: zinc ribbon domain-containing protein [Actinomycetota bacterium]|nr:zinc ribbon domain-containing protein [Actinomycetota bacterium]
MRACPRCGGSTSSSFRYCPWCAAPQRLKLVEFFQSHPGIAADRGKSLRVSRYLAPVVDERHVRISVWAERGDLAEAEAAVSLEDAEARRLARFLLETEPEPAPRSLAAQVRAYLAGRP